MFALTASITVVSLQAQKKKLKRSDLSPAVEKTMAEQMNEEAVAPSVVKEITPVLRRKQVHPIWKSYETHAAIFSSQYRDAGRHRVSISVQ